MEHIGNSPFPVLSIENYEVGDRLLPLYIPKENCSEKIENKVTEESVSDSLNEGRDSVYKLFPIKSYHADQVLPFYIPIRNYDGIIDNKMTEDSVLNSPNEWRHSISKRKREKSDFDGKKIKQRIQDFAEKVVENLTKHLNLKCDQDKNWLWNDDTSTGQNIQSLKKKINQFLNKTDQWTKFAIQFQRKGGAVRFAIVNSSTGAVTAIAKKIKELGSSQVAKIESWKIKKVDSNQEAAIRAIKLIDSRGIEPEMHNQYVEYLQNEADILNILHKTLKQKQQEDSTDHLQYAIQAPYEKKFIVLSETNNDGIDLDYQVGMSNIVYDGDAFIDLENDWRKLWTSLELMRAFCNLFKCLEEIHALDILHGDIKLENIFRKGKGLYLADFGGAVNVKRDEKCLSAQNVTVEDPTMNIHVHTDIWTLWEDLKKLNGIIINQKDRNLRIEKYLNLRKKMDVFSLGGALFFCLTGNFPHGKAKNLSDGRKYIESIQSEEKLEKMLHQSPFAKEYKGLGSLIARILDVSFEKRPTAGQAFEQLNQIINKY